MSHTFVMLLSGNSATCLYNLAGGEPPLRCFDAWDEPLLVGLLRAGFTLNFGLQIFRFTCMLLCLV